MSTTGYMELVDYEPRPETCPECGEPVEVGQTMAVVRGQMFHEPCALVHLRGLYPDGAATIGTSHYWIHEPTREDGGS